MAEQYVWRPDGANSHADPDGPPMSKTFNAKDSEAVMLPKASVTVLRGRIN